MFAVDVSAWKWLGTVLIGSVWFAPIVSFVTEMVTSSVAYLVIWWVSILRSQTRPPWGHNRLFFVKHSLNLMKPAIWLSLSVARLMQSTSHHPVFVKGTPSAPRRLIRGLWWILFVKPYGGTQARERERVMSTSLTNSQHHTAYNVDVSRSTSTALDRQPYCWQSV
jgi:hypothetical protein